MLRYYEQQGLLDSTRAPNGYREYPDAAVETVRDIRGLIASGLSTKLIRAVMGLDGVRGTALAKSCSRDVAESLAAELRGLDERIACLTKSRETVRDFLARTRHASLMADGAMPAADLR